MPGRIKADMLAFDHQIRTHRQNIPDHSIKARAGRAAKINDNMQDGELAFAARCPCTPLLFVGNAVHSRQTAAAGSHPSEETKIERHCGLLSWMCCPCTLGLICFCPLDKQEVFASDGKRVNELCHHTAHGKIKDSCKLRRSRWLPFRPLSSA